MELTNLKKQNVTEEEAPKGISKLPHPLLVEIFSLLPTEDAFRTCVISKEWQRLSTLIHSFNFTYREREDFSLIHNALAHTLSPKIKKFQLDFSHLCLSDCSFRTEYETLVSHCFCFSVERQVENVVFWFQYSYECTLPESFCTCSSLITLDVKHCGFNNAVISWNSLKSIKLGHLMLTDDEMVKLLSGCPALETMELYSYHGFRRLESNSLLLQTLKLKDYQFPENGNDLEILAPYLQHLEISGELYNLNIAFSKDIPSFYEGDSCRDYHQTVYSLVQNNLQKLCDATELTMGTWFTEFNGVPVSELNCKYLTLVLHMKIFNMYGVAGLLRASPHVETTQLDDFPFYFLDDFRCKSELLDLAKGDDMDLLSGVSSVEYHNLKKVKIVISSEACLKDHVKRGFEKVSKLLEFLLLNALVLENFVIVSKKRRCETCSINCLSQFLSRLADNLLGCPRSSTNSEIIFHE
ncbi:F-box protein At5g03100-like [Solanum tuberosum]|uniref:F-box protein At5g03100-like n=1 Tax=Solanum tuberosum TaxID=4113 RepID=UPI0003D25BC6|nr:PREDICTED: F-box protein At5g03100-like [Solanum tuberosum]